MPRSFRDYVKLLLVRRRYPGRTIHTPYVHPTAKLGMHCRLHRGVQVGPNVSIGDYSYVNDGTLIGSGTIGRFCSLAYYCEIGMHEHPLDHVSTSPFIYGPQNIFQEAELWHDFRSPPIIGNDVWMASGAKICRAFASPTAR